MTAKIREIYRKVFRKNIKECGEAEENAIQSLVYVLINMGADIGSYDFEWDNDKMLPCSVKLEEKIRKPEKHEKRKIKFSDFALLCMKKIRRVQAEINSVDPDGVWLEYAASYIWYRNIMKMDDEAADTWVKAARRFHNLEKKDVIIHDTAERFVDVVILSHN